MRPATKPRESNPVAKAVAKPVVEWQDAWFHRTYEQSVSIDVPAEIPDKPTARRSYLYTLSLETDVAPKSQLIEEGERIECDSADLHLHYFDSQGGAAGNSGDFNLPISLAGFDTFIEALQQLRETVRRHEGR